MKTGINREEALSLLRHAATEPLGVLVYASEAQPFIQALYRAKREDLSLQYLQIRQTPEGIAVCHDPISYPDAPQGEAPQGELSTNAESDDSEGVVRDDTEVDTGNQEVPSIPVQE